MRRVACRGWEAPSGKPVQTRGAQGTSGIRAAFSLDTFFWRSKRKYLGRRSENRLINNRRDSDTSTPSNREVFSIIQARNHTVGVILSNDRENNSAILGQSSITREIFSVTRARNSVIQEIFLVVPVQNSIRQDQSFIIGVILSNNQAPNSNNRENFSVIQAFFSIIPLQNSISQAQNLITGVILPNSQALCSNSRKPSRTNYIQKYFIPRMPSIAF
ncbi:hypothetical protein [Methylomonas albis]|uniref:Uncharacterized protein n=1 Tax=Methylomonas albis TaxID=1854563 RepID=A0ABR9D2W2_9GAMM|nr:hypothetical protein [Methylomonas albis]MBD9357451.1 hypothetical protein [Methylomonas albis]